MSQRSKSAPLQTPALHGSSVRYFDVLDSNGLRKRAEEHGLDPGNVPEIDYVSPTGDLTIIPEKFRLVFSSHCIEHQPDLIGHLKAVERLLMDGGQYAMIVPDCRYCFDYFLPPSNIAEVISAHYEGRRLHTLRSIIEHRALITHNEPARHWRGDHGKLELEPVKIHAAIDEWRSSNGRYIDVHAWQFTPDTFREIIVCLNELGYIRLALQQIHDTLQDSFEFHVVLTVR